MTIEQESDAIPTSKKNLVFAYYVTSHGFSHATRVVEVVQHLILAGHDVYAVTGALDFVFTSDIQSPHLFIHKIKPISYEKARKFFAQDPSQKWAAYIARAIVILMNELGVHFEDSISMLVSSTVLEGKGVSSFASVEVASMHAIAVAHRLNISPRDLALLCQKVENHIVGAPCSVMDQMASACGEANKLLAMICQPAEIVGLVEIPNHIRF